MPTETVLVWFENDLRLADNPALETARHHFKRLIPVVIWGGSAKRHTGAAARWWLHHSLLSLQGRLVATGSRLIIRQGEAGEVLTALAAESDAGAVWWNDRIDPDAARRAKTARDALAARGIATRVFDADLLHDPETIRGGRPYQVFTAFWRANLRTPPPPPPRPAPRRLPPVPPRLRSASVASLSLLPTVPWDAGLSGAWRPGENSARQRLRAFCRAGLARYAERRDLPAIDGTSRLSPHLHFGELSPRQVAHAVRKAVENGHPPGAHAGAEAFLRQLYWREFAYHLLRHHPASRERPLDRRFESFPWRDDPETLTAWQRGETGIPLVDAGMRELWQTGWMHNRARLIVASFLSKNLLLPWQQGAAWFMETLVDADVANNTLGWQWSAGCGADAAPFFRIFNPVAQAQRYDPDGAYLRRWLPELAGLPARWLPRPWSAPSNVLEQAGVRLGETYPPPIVDLRMSRERALRAFERMRRHTGPSVRGERHG